MLSNKHGWEEGQQWLNSSVDFTIFIYKLCKPTAASYQSEDQVIESRGGQQEQQDGEEQSSNEELQRAEQ